MKPLTLEEAKAYRYNKWAGNPKGTPYNPNRCAYERWTSGRGSLPYQCSHKPHAGPGNLYCGTHARMLAPKPEPEPDPFKRSFRNPYPGILTDEQWANFYDYCQRLGERPFSRIANLIKQDIAPPGSGPAMMHLIDKTPQA